MATSVSSSNVFCVVFPLATNIILCHTSYEHSANPRPIQLSWYFPMPQTSSAAVAAAAAASWQHFLSHAASHCHCRQPKDDSLDGKTYITKAHGHILREGCGNKNCNQAVNNISLYVSMQYKAKQTAENVIKRFCRWNEWMVVGGLHCSEFVEHSSTWIVFLAFTFVICNLFFTGARKKHQLLTHLECKEAIYINIYI